MSSYKKYGEICRGSKRGNLKQLYNGQFVPGRTTRCKERAMARVTI